MRKTQQRLQLENELKAVILKHFKKNGIDPYLDQEKAMANSSAIWEALVKSGKLPPTAKFIHLLRGMQQARTNSIMEEMMRGAYYS